MSMCPRACPTVSIDPLVSGGVSMVLRIYKQDTWTRTTSVSMDQTGRGADQ